MYHDVFISYSNKDQKIVEALSHYLEERNIRCFMPYRDAPKGVDWINIIREAISKCQMMVVICSNNIEFSKQVDSEIKLCVELNNPILTFCIQDVDFLELRNYHQLNKKRIDAFSNPNENFQSLYESIAKLIVIETTMIPQEKPLPNEKNYIQKLDRSMTLKTQLEEVQRLKDFSNKKDKNFNRKEILDEEVDMCCLPREIEEILTDQEQCIVAKINENEDSISSNPVSLTEIEKDLPIISLTESEKDKIDNMMESIEAKKKTSKFSSVSRLKGILVDIGGLVVGSVQFIPKILNKDKKLRFKKNIIIDKSPVTLSLFAPSQLKRSEDMLVQVYLHSKKLVEKITSKANIRDANSELRANETLDAKLNFGDVVEVKLIMPQGVEVDNPIQKVIWKNELKPIDFVVNVPSNYKLGDMIGTVYVCKDSLPICSIKFVTKIVTQTQNEVSPASTYPIYYKKVFVSYSSTDREEVLKVTSGFKALHVDFFLDKLYLEGGDKYKDKIFDYINEADLFLLCWSINAEQSEWVRKEYKYALERINRPDMSLSLYPIVIQPKANPPLELNDYHFVEI